MYDTFDAPSNSLLASVMGVLLVVSIEAMSSPQVIRAEFFRHTLSCFLHIFVVRAKCATKQMPTNIQFSCA